MRNTTKIHNEKSSQCTVTDAEIEFTKLSDKQLEKVSGGIEDPSMLRADENNDIINTDVNPFQDANTFQDVKF